MDSLDNIIETMVMQHRILQKYLGEIKIFAEAAEPEINLIGRNLRSFAVALAGHRQLEEGIFYPELLKRMAERGSDITKIKEFIGEMIKISEVIEVFLNKYPSEAELRTYLSDFRPALEEVSQKLNLRIESEEAGVFSYWSALQAKT